MANAYRFGFNGKEKDSEWDEGGATYDYRFRIYDARIAKFLSVDPLSKHYPGWSPYPFAMNRPINGIDLDGAEWVLKIYSPLLSTKFTEAVNEKDLYEQRRLTYYAVMFTAGQNFRLVVSKPV